MQDAELFSTSGLGLASVRDNARVFGKSPTRNVAPCRLHQQSTQGGVRLDGSQGGIRETGPLGASVLSLRRRRHVRKPDKPCHLEATGRPARTRHNLSPNRLDILEIVGCEAQGLASSEPSPSRYACQGAPPSKPDLAFRLHLPPTWSQDLDLSLMTKAGFHLVSNAGFGLISYRPSSNVFPVFSCVSHPEFRT